jgi:adenine-specific DNA-methyltransferase
VLVDAVDFFRLDVARRLNPNRQAELGQFMTPPPTARLMASMFATREKEIRVLDAGAGVGSLTAAFIDEICARAYKPGKISATIYEIEQVFQPYIGKTIEQCRKTCEMGGISFEAKIYETDFIEDGVRKLRQRMFEQVQHFNCAILNPPYKKIHSDSEMRFALREIGVETSNLYTGFLALVLMLLEDGGELVAITPRSFCNGPYFKPFRRLLLENLSLRRIHIFDSRDSAFGDDGVLQENVILYGVKGSAGKSSVMISSSSTPEDEVVSLREVGYQEIVHPGDAEYFIHIVPDGLSASIAEQMDRLYWTLEDHDVQVSTGRVVDFRATPLLCQLPGPDTAPLIYPRNIVNGFVEWPKPGGKKPQAIRVGAGSTDLLVPKGMYVLTKRFSSKEERKRVVAGLYDPSRLNADLIGFENHLNYFHRNGHGLPTNLAKGFMTFLNSTLVDLFFRQFSGHTQINATDLRKLKYPTRSQLEALGSRIGNNFPEQDVIDSYVEDALKLEEAGGIADPVKAKKKMDEALAVLKALGLPREQQNERSALSLLALLDLKPNTAWSKAKAPLIGITPMMNYFEVHYGKKYAPNTRETVRRQTIHQFLDAGLVQINPDKPDRAVNSPAAVYQIDQSLLKLIRTFGTPEWDKSLATYLASTETLKKRYAQEREMRRIPITLPMGKTIALSPGGQNILVERIIKDFCPLFTHGGKPVYIGDTDEKWAYFDSELLKSLGVKIDAHGKMPDVVIYVEQKNWLVLIEAVTSHGPVSPKRRGELKVLFEEATAGLVFVTAFLDRKAMIKYLGDISWETEVWVADSPTHLIHFDGERFLGPYQDKEEE